jgi:heme A synthase
VYNLRRHEAKETPPGRRREEKYVKQTYRVVAGLIALGVLVQAAAVALAWFQVIGDIESGAVFDENAEFNLGHLVHLYGGLYAIPALGLILLVVSFLAAKSVPNARKWGGIVFGLIVLQVALAIFAFAIAPAIGALHGLNALLLLGAALKAVSLTRTGAGGATGVALPRQRSESPATGSSLSV